MGCYGFCLDYIYYLKHLSMPCYYFGLLFADLGFLGGLFDWFWLVGIVVCYSCLLFADGFAGLIGLFVVYLFDCSCVCLFG